MEQRVSEWSRRKMKMKMMKMIMKKFILKNTKTKQKQKQHHNYFFYKFVSGQYDFFFVVKLIVFVQFMMSIFNKMRKYVSMPFLQLKQIIKCLNMWTKEIKTKQNNLSIVFFSYTKKKIIIINQIMPKRCHRERERKKNHILIINWSIVWERRV